MSKQEEKKDEKQHTAVVVAAAAAAVVSTVYNWIMGLKTKTVLKVILYSVVGPILMYSLFFSFLLLQYYQEQEQQSITIRTKVSEINERENPLYFVYAKSNKNDNASGYLKHVFVVLERLGFKRTYNDSNWDLLWAHDYPFRVLNSNLKRLQAHQRVNHFPGCGYITNKVDLSTTTRGRYILPAFKMPSQKDEFLRYATKYPEKMFVEKSNDHRGISVRNISDIINVTAAAAKTATTTTTGSSFIQEFIQRPYLVDGYKFDIGVYAAITSVDPLRVYVYKGDALFRFCPVKYYPFDPQVLNKYVVGDDYLPIWNVPSLRRYYDTFKCSMKDSFDAYVRRQGKNPEKVWHSIYEAIKEITLSKENYIKDAVAKRFGNGRNFFELVRIDFALDEDLNVYTMEANMSPNLSSAHYPPNRLLYEQVLYNLFALVGVGQRVRKDSLKIRNKMEEEMEVADKNLMILPELCATECDDCFRVECQLCSPCFTTETKSILSQSYLEHQNKMDFQRIFPPPPPPPPSLLSSSLTKTNTISKNYTLKNQLLIRWYQGKCELDRSWCS